MWVLSKSNRKLFLRLQKSYTPLAFKIYFFCQCGEWWQIIRQFTSMIHDQWVNSGELQTCLHVNNFFCRFLDQSYACWISRIDSTLPWYFAIKFCHVNSVAHNHGIMYATQIQKAVKANPEFRLQNCRNQIFMS